MAKKKKVIGSLVNEVSFKVDKASWNNINKFEKRLKDLQKVAKGLSTTIDVKLGKIGKDLQVLSQPQGIKGRTQAEIDLATRLTALKIAEKESKLANFAQKQADRQAAKQDKADRASLKTKKLQEAEDKKSARQAKQLSDAKIMAERRIHLERIRLQRKIDQTIELSRHYKIDKNAVQAQMPKFEAAAAAYSANPMNKAALEHYRTKVGEIGNEFSKWRGAPRTGIMGVVHELKTMRGTLLTVGALAVAAGGKFAYDTTKSMQNLNASMAYASGGVEQAAKDMNWLKGEANRLGVDIEGLGQSFVKLQASSKGKMPGEDIKELISGFTEYAKVVGVSNEKIQLGYYAFTNMIDKQYIYAEDLFQQLAEQVPGAAVAFERALGVKSGGLRDYLKEMKPLTKDVLPLVSKEYRKIARESGALSKALKTLESQENRIRNAFKLTFNFTEDANALKTMENSMESIAASMEIVGEIFKTILQSDTLRQILATVRLIIAGWGGIVKVASKDIQSQVAYRDYIAKNPDKATPDGLIPRWWANETNRMRQGVAMQASQLGVAPEQIVEVRLKMEGEELGRLISAKVDQIKKADWSSILNNIGGPD